MTKTAFTHEILEDGTAAHRVTLTLDATEAAALGEVAGAAVDASVLLGDMVTESVAENAQAILSWAVRAATALEILEQGKNPGTE